MQKKLLLAFLILTLGTNISYARIGGMVGSPLFALMPGSPLLEWSFSFDGHGKKKVYQLNSVDEVSGVQQIYSGAMIVGTNLKLHSNSGREASWYGLFGMGTTVGVPNIVGMIPFSAAKAEGDGIDFSHDTERRIFETKFGIGHQNWVYLTNNKAYYSVDYSFIKTNYYLYFYDQQRSLSCLADGSTLSNALALSVGYDITRNIAMSVATSWWNLVTLGRSSAIAACNSPQTGGGYEFIPVIIKDNKEQAITVGLHFYM